MKKPSMVLIGCLSLVVFRGTLSANQQDATDSPLQLRTTVEEPTLICDVTNKSNKDIAAYTIVVDLFDSAGKAAGQLSANAIMSLAINSKGSTGSFAPAATRRSNRFTLPTDASGKAPGFKVFVDFILFKDGSTWGADVTKQSLRIMGINEGWRQSRAQLKQLLSERGIQAVADALVE